MGKIFWYQHQLRIVQTVLREIDAINYCAESVVDYLKKSSANCIVVNGGGIVDFFQNTLKPSNINVWLDNDDILADLIAIAHTNNIRVLARVDFRGVPKEIFDQCCDWFAQDQSGNPMLTGYTGTPLYTPCYNGYYRNEHAVDFINEIMSRYDFDGIWHNCIAVWDICYCPRCRELYRNEFGTEIPDSRTANAGLMNRYWDWKANCAERNMELMRSTVKKFGEEKAYAAEIFGMFDTGRPRKTGLDLYSAGKYFDFLVSVAFLTENKEAVEYEELGYASIIARFLRSLDVDKSPVILYGTNGTTHRYVMDPPTDLRIWQWEGASLGSGFWNCLFNGSHPANTHDRRNAYLATDTYVYLEKHSRLLENVKPFSPINVFYSKPTRTFIGKDNRQTDEYSVAMLGACSTLLENHLQFGFSCDNSFSQDMLSGTELIILTNIACVSDRHSDILREFVSRGGKLIASYETSLYDESGNKRQDFALSDLFGLSYTGVKKDTKADCYQLIRDSSHAVLDGINNTELLMNDGFTLLCNMLSGSSALCSYTPKIPNQPPEKAWVQNLKTDFPTIVVNRFGKGEVVYFANQTDRLCFSNGHDDFRKVYSNAVKYLMRDSDLLKTNAPESVHIAHSVDRNDPQHQVISLVNLTTGPWRPARSIVPVFDISVTISGILVAFENLYEHTPVEVQQVGAAETRPCVNIHIPKLEEFASVHLTLR